MRSLVATAVLLGMLVSLGCKEPATSDGGSPPVASDGGAAEIQLPKGDAKALQALIDEHKGKVVFVDYWATWCGPCVENFPHTVELHEKYRDQGLATIAVSFDLLADEAKVRQFLAKQKAGFQNLISKHDEIGQGPAIDFDVEALPQYRLYDRQGKLRHKWEGHSDEIEQQMQALLAEK